MKRPFIIPNYVGAILLASLSTGILITRPPNPSMPSGFANSQDVRPPNPSIPKGLALSAEARELIETCQLITERDIYPGTNYYLKRFAGSTSHNEHVYRLYNFSNYETCYAYLVKKRPTHADATTAEPAYALIAP